MASTIPMICSSIKGEKELARYLVDEVQEVYRLQGVKINDKQTYGSDRPPDAAAGKDRDPGDTTFIADEQVERSAFQEEKRTGGGGQGAKAGNGEADSAGNYEGVPVYAELYLCGFLPGDHAGADGSQPGG